MTLGQQDAFVALLEMVNKLVQNWVEGLLLVSIDLEVDVSVAVLGLAEGDLIVELRVAHGLLMGLHDSLDQFLRDLGCDFLAKLLLSLPFLLCLPFKILRSLEGLSVLLACRHVLQRYANCRLLVS